MSKEKEIVMNVAGIEEIGFPMWPQFNEKSYDEGDDSQGKYSYEFAAAEYHSRTKACCYQPCREYCKVVACSLGDAHLFFGIY